MIIALAYNRMQRDKVATARHAKLEMITGCALDSGWLNDGTTPGGGGAAGTIPATSRAVMIGWGSGPPECIMTAGAT